MIAIWSSISPGNIPESDGEFAQGDSRSNCLLGQCASHRWQWVEEASEEKHLSALEEVLR